MLPIRTPCPHRRASRSAPTTNRASSASLRSLATIPMVHVLLVTRLLARAFGTYSSTSAASRMRSLVSRETDPFPWSTLPAVWKLTAALEATSSTDTCVRWRLVYGLALRAGGGAAVGGLALEAKVH